jgi:hypothetical protein
MYVYCTTVSRGVSQGEHGALYRVNLETEEVIKLLTYLDEIDYSGRGGDRGLRGLILHDDMLYVAAANHVLQVSLEGNIVDKLEHRNLGFLHDIQKTDTGLLVVSTKYDCVMEYNFDKGDWVKCYYVNEFMEVIEEDSDIQLQPHNLWHLNSLNDFFVSGLRTSGAVHLKQTGNFVEAPLGIHNWSPAMYNDTHVNTIGVGDRRVLVDDGTFLRGLSTSEHYTVVGQCPAKIIVFDNEFNLLKKISLSNDKNSSVQSLLISMNQN